MSATPDAEVCTPLDADRASNALRRATPLQHLVITRPSFDAGQLRGILRHEITPHEVRRLRDRGVLLGVRCGRHGYLYPQFQVEMRHRRFSPVAAKVNRVLTAALDTEESLRWWFERSTRTGRTRTESLELPDELMADARRRTATV